MSSIAKTDEGFYSERTLPKNKVLTNLQQALKATIPFTTTRFQPTKCTGTFTSNNGYVATALHCISQCLIAQGFLESFKEDRPKYEVEKAQSPIPARTRCTLIYDGYTYDADVVLVGKGYSFFDPAAIDSYDSEAKEMFNNLNQDFAILKLPLTQTSCLQRAAPAVAGAQVWQVGYPKNSQRSKCENSGGGEKFISFGKVYGSHTENPQLNGRIKSLSSTVSSYLINYFLKPSLILTNVDTLSGNSGSPLLDSLGNFIGVTSTLLVYDSISQASEYVEPLVLHVSTESIFEKAQKDLGDKKANEIFSCK